MTEKSKKKLKDLFIEDLGKVSGGKPASTDMVGEEGPTETTLALGEEDGPSTTTWMGEE